MEKQPKLLSYQHYCSFLRYYTIIFGKTFNHPHINTTGLFLTTQTAIPPIIKFCSWKDHLAPAVEDPEIIIAFHTHREGCELIVLAIIIRRKSCWHINIRAFIHPHFYIAFSPATCNRGSYNLVLNILSDCSNCYYRIGNVQITCSNGWIRIA